MEFFFPNHAKLRGNLDPRKMKTLEKKITGLQPDFYFDRKHENYQAHIEDTIVPFELRLHNSLPGTIAIAKTVIPQGGQSIDRDRIREIPVHRKRRGCPECGQSKSIVGD